MDQRSAFPWPAMALALASCVVLAFSDAGPALAMIVLLLWAGTLWLATSKPPETPVARNETMLDGPRVSALVEHSGTPIIVIERGRVASLNRAARKLLGKHLVGQDPRVAFRQPEAIRLLEKGKSGSARLRNLARRQDVWLFNLQKINKKMFVIELVNQSAESTISRAHTDFVANASHELRTPLASIIGYVETLEEEGEELPEATRAQFFATVLNEARRLQSLVSDLMSLSRVEAEKHDTPSDPLDLADIVQTAARDAAGLEHAERLRFNLTSDAKIAGDRRQIEQLVRNLVDNALKYGSCDEPVDISLREIGVEERDGDASGIALVVSDQGEGIAPEHLPHLTRRFYRTDPGRSRASGGTGLGLAIVKHIVERHRAHLDITSKQGEGTTITIRFPRLIDGQD